MVEKTIWLPGIMLTIASIILVLGLFSTSYGQKDSSMLDQQINSDWPNVHQNTITSFNSNTSFPSIEETAFIHPFAIVIGNCYIGEMVMVAPTAVCRADEGTPLHIGTLSNIQDGVVIHGLVTTLDGGNLDNRRYTSGGDLLLGNDSRFDSGYSVYIGENVSLAHGALIHGPAYVGNDTFIGMESMVFNAKIGNEVAIGVASTITGGVEIADNKFIPPGSVITTQEQADNLPDRIGSDFESINAAVVPVNEELARGFSEITANEELAKGYKELGLEKSIVEERETSMEKGMIETSLPP